MEANNCKICGDSRVSVSINGDTDIHRIICPICGYYKITFTAYVTDSYLSEEDKILFCGYLRNNSTKKHPIVIDTETYKNIPDTISPFRRLTVDERIDLIIRYIAENTKTVGVPMDMYTTYPVFYLKNDGEVMTYLDWLEKMDLGKRRAQGFILGPGGWRRYEKTKEINIKSKQVFIAMNFKEKLDYIYNEGIYPACSECDFDAIRVDRIEHNQKICDKIIAEIKRSRFLIADFTEQRYGVYFETGYAYGLGLPVIWTCKKGEEEVLHFDTRQYNHITWGNVKELKEKLVNRIKATIK